MKLKVSYWKISTKLKHFNQTDQEKERIFKLLKSGLKEQTLCQPYRSKRIIREYYEQSYTNNLYNLGEVDKFLERGKPKLILKERETLIIKKFGQ